MCNELAVLRKRFEGAITTFDAATQSLLIRIGVCPNVEFRALSRELDRAYIELSRARRVLHDHITTHDCQAGTA